MKKMLKRFYNFITGPVCGRHAGKIVLCTFALLFLSVGVLAHVSSLQGEAISETNEMPDGVDNGVRWSSVEYVFTFDDTINSATRENILKYFYSTVDSVKLLHMVNMQQKVVFSKNTKELYIEDNIIYSPSNIDVRALETAIDSLE